MSKKLLKNILGSMLVAVVVFISNPKALFAETCGINYYPRDKSITPPRCDGILLLNLFNDLLK